MTINPKLVEATHKWLGKDGLAFFKGLKQKYGKVDALWIEHGIPHPVHFREGMQVRNFMRESGFCDGWTCHDYDNNWVTLIEEVLSEKG